MRPPRLLGSVRACLAVATAATAAACAALPARQVPDAAELSPEEAGAWRDAATALDRGDAESALGLVAPVLPVEPWHVPAHALRQDALAAAGRAGEAAAWYRAEAERVPGDARRALLAARLTPRARGEREHGYRAALALDPSSPWARIALAYELVRQAREGDRTATKVADEGYAFDATTVARATEKSLADAEALVRGALGDRPDLAAVHHALGEVLLARSMYGARDRALDASRRSAALDSALEATRLDPGDPLAWELVGRIRRAAGDDAGAAEALQMAARLAPRDGAVRAHLGRVLLELRRDGDAREALESAAELLPGDAFVHLNLGVARFRRRDVRGAVASFERAARLDPGDARCWYALALARAEAGDRPGAADAMERYLGAGGADREGARRFVDEMRGASAAGGTSP